MNILIVGKFYVEGFALHIAETLDSMGHRVTRFEPGVKYRNLGGRTAKRWQAAKSVLYSASSQLPTFQRRQTDALLRTVANRQIDICIVCHDFLFPKQVAMLKSATHARVALWFPDSIGRFDRSCFLNAEYGALFFKDPYIVRVLSDDLGKPVYYLPECCNPLRHKPAQITAEDVRKYGCDIATAGNVYPYRVEFFSQLKEYNVRIWGNPPAMWLNTSGIEPMLQGQFVANADKAKAFGAAKIVLNNLHPAEIWGLNARAFEAAATGAFQFVNWRPGLSQLFDDGKELISFRSVGDLREKVDYYLPRDEERRAIALAASQRALSEHTYARRLSLLLDTLTGDGTGFPMPNVVCDSAT